MSTQRRSWAIFAKEDVENLYKYEYLLSMIENQGLRESSIYNTYYHKLKQKAEKLTDKMVKTAINAIESWALFHNIMFTEEEILNTRGEKKGDIFSFVFDIHDVWKMLKNANDLSDKFLALNYTLHLVHHQVQSGKDSPLIGIGEEYAPDPLQTEDWYSMDDYFSSLNYLSRERGMPLEEIEQFLDNLSKGKITKWEYDLKRRASNINWYRFALIQKSAKIVEKGSQWCVESEDGKNMGCYDTKKEAEERLRQIEYFKHKD
jgi:hypothetical protein